MLIFKIKNFSFEFNPILLKRWHSLFKVNNYHLREILMKLLAVMMSLLLVGNVFAEGTQEKAAPVGTEVEKVAPKAKKKHEKKKVEDVKTEVAPKIENVKK
jgi:hypothetical protein